MKNITLKRIFFIYSEASLAVFLAAIALVELICYIALFREPLAFIPLIAAIGFAVLSATLALVVYRDAKRTNLI